MCRLAGVSPGRRRATRLTAFSGFRLERRLSSSFLQGTRPRKLGHPDVTTDDTAFPRWDTVRPRFPVGRSGRRSASLSWPRCRSEPVHLPKATSGYPLGCSPRRSKERAERPRGWVPLQERRKGIAYPPTPACRNEDDNCLSVRKSIQGSEPSGPPPAKTYPSRPAHPEEHAGRRHRSSPRPARVRRLHAHRWRLRG